MNDCRIHDLASLTDGPIDIQWLQYSGAIWYPMVYDHPPDVMRELVDQKIDAHCPGRSATSRPSTRAWWCPRRDLRASSTASFLNVIDGDELSIFPDQTVFIERLRRRPGHRPLAIPGTTFDITRDRVSITHLPDAEADVERIFAPSGSTSSATPRTGDRGSNGRRPPGRHRRRTSWAA